MNYRSGIPLGRLYALADVIKKLEGYHDSPHVDSLPPKRVLELVLEDLRPTFDRLRQYEAWPFPWEPSKGMYDSDGPRGYGAPLVVEGEIDGTAFRVSRTKKEGIHSGRIRYKTECVTCDEVLHKATTGPTSRIRDHLIEKHKWLPAWPPEKVIDHDS